MAQNQYCYHCCKTIYRYDQFTLNCRKCHSTICPECLLKQQHYNINPLSKLAVLMAIIEYESYELNPQKPDLTNCILYFHSHEVTQYMHETYPSNDPNEDYKHVIDEFELFKSKIIDLSSSSDDEEINTDEFIELTYSLNQILHHPLPFTCQQCTPTIEFNILNS